MRLPVNLTVCKCTGRIGQRSLVQPSSSFVLEMEAAAEVKVSLIVRRHDYGSVTLNGTNMWLFLQGSTHLFVLRKRIFLCGES